VLSTREGLLSVASCFLLEGGGGRGGGGAGGIVGDGTGGGLLAVGEWDGGFLSGQLVCGRFGVITSAAGKVVDWLVPRSASSILVSLSTFASKS
jgi:hypothetical protein